MQIDLLTQKHEKFLSDIVGISPDEFKAMSYDELDALVDDVLIELECDGAEEGASDESRENTSLAADIIDIIYGPYDGAEQAEEKVEAVPA